MRESPRDEDLSAVDSGKNDSSQASHRWRFRAQINGYVEHYARHDAHKLRLRMIDLKM